MHAENVFLSPFKTTNGMVPFDRISVDLYEPSIQAGIAEQNKEIEAITSQTAAPTFENTIVALERSGSTLNRVLGVFYALRECNSDAALSAVGSRMAPVLSDHSNSINLNEALWKRVKAVYDNADRSKLDTEDKMLLERTYTQLCQQWREPGGRCPRALSRVDAQAHRAAN